MNGYLRRAVLSGTFLTALLAPDLALAQSQPSPPIDPQNRQQVLQELQALRGQRQSMQQEMSDFDARIQALEAALGVASPPAAQSVAATAQDPAVSTQPGDVQTNQVASLRDLPQPTVTPSFESSETAALQLNALEERLASWGPFEPGRGLVLARGDVGELSLGIYTYGRYLNQLALDETYTDSFGRTFTIDRRQDIQLYKANIYFRGWLLTPRFRYMLFVWTNNASQGNGAQVVVAGSLSYIFSDAATLSVGILPVPGTRTTNLTFPHWLRNDNRTLADEFFRGSYTSGVHLTGALARGLRYKLFLGNNLSTLGVSAAELDAGLNTATVALWWMPTTAEYGPAEGFGDFEEHERLATRFSATFTHSREDAQGQPETDAFDNTQIRLSDGTAIFSPNAFNTGANIRRATYWMGALSAGAKYRGFSLEGEYYFRWVDDFVATGPIPVTELFDHGFQVQASAMAIPRVLQPYVSGSYVFGEYGDPWDIALGVNWFPFRRKEVSVNLQALYMSHSPVGGISYPYAVGSNGWIGTLAWILAF